MLDRQTKPLIALMGEFSAGKSTLANLLLGQRPLPVRVTATRLPPVWISYGADSAEVHHKDGNRTPVALDQLESVCLDTASFLHLRLPSEVLELCDLIDMPGISDPNLPADIWRATLPKVDCAIWCTPATQAWRQSEAAFWSVLAPQMRASVLLITQFDKLTSKRDKNRVLQRIKREASAQFDAVFGLSLTDAMTAGADMNAWKGSGADSFVEHLIDLLLHWETQPTQRRGFVDASLDRLERRTEPPSPHSACAAPALHASAAIAPTCSTTSLESGSIAAPERVQPRRIRPLHIEEGTAHRRKRPVKATTMCTNQSRIPE